MKENDMKTFGFFSKEDGLCFYHDVKGLLEEIGINCHTTEWRLFIDISTRSLKVVLLHNGNKFPSIRLAHVYTSKKIMTVLECF